MAPNRFFLPGVFPKDPVPFFRLVWLATSPDIAHVSGAYFFDRQQKRPNPKAQDREIARRLWEISERQCAVSEGGAEVPELRDNLRS
jgi:hypothetical protein